jgi:hypothetical protein
VWPPSFTLARAYLDQLSRSQGLAAARIAALRRALADAEQAAPSARRDALTGLAARLDRDAAASPDTAKVRLLARAVRTLADAGR